MNQPIAWRNGTVIAWQDAALPVWDLGVVAGASVTEMARTFGHRIFRLDAHLDRLLSSLDVLGFPQSYDRKTLADAAESVVRANAKLIVPHHDLGLVIFATAGGHATYLDGHAAEPTTMIHTFELPLESWRSAFETGVRLRVSAVRQIPEECFPVGLKVRNRLHWWLADQAASRIEPGSRALLLDAEGMITETSTSCVYVIKGDEIATPQRNVLDSLSRRVVAELCQLSGLRFQSRDIRPEELSTCDEVLLSSTPVCLLPVSHVDDRPIGGGRPGPVFRKLLCAWSELAGLDLAAQMRR